MKIRTILFAVVITLSYMCPTNAVAQNKKELLLMIENQNASINSLNQQIGVLTAQREQMSEQIKELKKQLEDLKALVAASNESKLVNTGWTKRDDFHSGLALIEDDNTNKYGFIDKTGKVVIPCEWTSAQSFGQLSNEATRVRNENDLCGIIDKTGKMVIPCQWKDIFIATKHNSLDSSLFSVKNENDLFGIIDKTGKVITPCKWKDIYYFDYSFEGLALVQNENGLWGFIDKTGKVVIPCKYNKIGRLQNNKLCVKTINGRDVYIDRTGREYNDAY